MTATTHRAGRPAVKAALLAGGLGTRLSVRDGFALRAEPKVRDRIEGSASVRDETRRHERWARGDAPRTVR